MLIGILADDLTGAADALAPFARRGFHASVGFERRHSTERFTLAEGDALAYDTATRDTRHEQAATIQNTVRRAARRLAELQPRVIFKKIDSTLRGHLRLELDAMRAEFPDRMALVCPAFPAQGRTVQSGVLHIHNVPWTQTEFAPAGMFASLTVRQAFGMDGTAGGTSAGAGSVSAAELGIGDIRQGADGLKTRLQDLRGQGIGAVFCDAALPSDLDALAQTILRAPQHLLCVGSAGLARALADALSSLPSAASPGLSPALFPPLLPPSLETLAQAFVNGRVLVIVGSLHAASRRQAGILAERLEQEPVVIASEGDFRRSAQQAEDRIREQFAGGQQVVLLTTPDAFGQGSGEGFALLAGSIARRACLSGLRGGLPIDGLVICGGDTARELCGQCGGTGLQITGEWQPGVALARLKAEPDPVDNISLDGLPLITKAGGFGDDLTLARCVGLMDAQE